MHRPGGSRGVQRWNHHERMGRVRVVLQYLKLFGIYACLKYQRVGTSGKMRTATANRRASHADQIAEELPESPAKQGAFVFRNNETGRVSPGGIAGAQASNRPERRTVPSAPSVPPP